MTTFNTGAYPPGCTQRDVDQAQPGYWDDSTPPTREQQEADAWEHWHQRAHALEAQNITLKRELAARAIRTMGPASPYWNCTICGASQQTPIMFQHKPECLLADTPHPSALVSGERHKQFYSIEVQHAQMIAALKDIEFIVDGKADADDGMPNDAMKIQSVVQDMLRKVEAAP